MFLLLFNFTLDGDIHRSGLLWEVFLGGTSYLYGNILYDFLIKYILNAINFSSHRF